MTTHRRASLFLIIATLVWGLSFPLTRALATAQQANLPQASTWFLTAVTVALRFGIAGAILLVWVLCHHLRPTRSEWWQGFGLAVFASGGMLFQNDGLYHTTASISAFLTQTYCAIIPLYTAVRLRKMPSFLEITAIFLVLIGVGLLSGVRWNDLRLGRGEWETLISSVFFAGQILWLERPIFHKNRPVIISTIMFMTIALLLSLFAGASFEHVSDFTQAFHGWPSLFLMALLTLACTLFTFCVMNFWQPHLSATHAGLIYCLEPVFVSIFALFLPGWLARWMQIPVENELFTHSLILGGIAILAANLAIIFAPKKIASLPG